jgi:hypothetical protein
MTVSIKIKNPKAKRILEDLAALNLIEITKETKSKVNRNSKSQEKTVTHLASEKSLAKTWNTPKEDEAWQDL